MPESVFVVQTGGAKRMWRIVKLMNATQRELGLSRVGILAIVGFVTLFGGIIWLTLRGDSQPSDTTTENGNQTQSTLTSPTVDPNAGYLVIKEWGVRLQMENADKVTYDFYDTPGTDPSGAGTYQSRISVHVKPEYLQDKSCDLGAGMYRFDPTDINQAFAPRGKKIGSYYYLIGDSPHLCGNDQDELVNQTIRGEFTLLRNLQPTE